MSATLPEIITSSPLAASDGTSSPLPPIAASPRETMQPRELTIEPPRSPRVVVAPFLEKLSTILNVEDGSVVGWSTNGMAFEILNQESFTEIILPKYFRHNKFASFQRQLNYFGFKKMSKSKAETCTYHRPNFTRDNPDGLKLIKRKTAQKSPRSSEYKLIPSAPSPCPSLKRQALGGLIGSGPTKWMRMAEDMSALKMLDEIEDFESVDEDPLVDIIDSSNFLVRPQPEVDMNIFATTQAVADMYAGCGGWFEGFDPSRPTLSNPEVELEVFNPVSPATDIFSGVINDADLFPVSPSTW